MKSIIKGINFLKESATEAKKITWPTPQEMLKQFIVVIVLSTLIVLILYLLDVNFAAFVKWLRTVV